MSFQVPRIATTGASAIVQGISSALRTSAIPTCRFHSLALQAKYYTRTSHLATQATAVSSVAYQNIACHSVSHSNGLSIRLGQIPSSALQIHSFSRFIHGNNDPLNIPPGYIHDVVKNLCRKYTENNLSKLCNDPEYKILEVLHNLQRYNFNEVINEQTPLDLAEELDNVIIVSLLKEFGAKKAANQPQL